MFNFITMLKRNSFIGITAAITLLFILIASSLSAVVLHPSANNSLALLSHWLAQHKIYFIFWHIILSIANITACSFKLKQFIKKHSLTPKQATQLKLFYGLLVGVIGTMILITFW